MKSYFIEGLQGAGKSTYVGMLEKQLSEQGYTAYREGDYSPVELAWCTYMTEKQYEEVLEKYAEIAEEIKAHTYTEDLHRVVCYTRIITDVPGFHKDMEQYEIYNGNISRTDYENIILRRFDNWKDEKGIFECSIFQNLIENDILFYEMSDDDIMEFYKMAADRLNGKDYEIVYLETDNVCESIDAIRRQRSDENGNELWFPMMMEYLEKSPYGMHNNINGFDGLIEHLQHRQELEIQILENVFDGRYQIVKSRRF